jgi:hypothetical protein
METPGLLTGQDTFRVLTVYLTAQLKADAEAKVLALVVAKAFGDLKTVDDMHGSLEDAMVATMALRDRVDMQVDDFVRAQFRAAQGVYGAKGRKLKVLYPEGVGGIIKGSIPEQPGEMRLLAARMESDENEKISAGAELMRENASTLKEAVDTFNVAVEQVAAAWSKVLRARAGWIRIYEKTYGELVSLKGKRAADGYFKPTRKRKKPTKPTE